MQAKRRQWLRTGGVPLIAQGKKERDLDRNTNRGGALVELRPAMGAMLHCMGGREVCYPFHVIGKSGVDAIRAFAASYEPDGCPRHVPIPTLSDSPRQYLALVGESQWRDGGIQAHARASDSIGEGDAPPDAGVVLQGFL